jgi:2-polyprenyl-6-methoxyphenol hydroxylase-like FAD-dependent oxidoreductase
MVDRDPLPSDQVLSTHTIHPPGVDILDELGVGDAVRSVAPPSPRVRIVKGSAWADAEFADGRAEYCPRRERLDGLLQAAAVEGGVELRDRTQVEEVIFDDGRAVGVRLRSADAFEEVRCGLVVGADGRNSKVAARVGAEEYLAYDAPRAMYWAYWDAPDEWWTDRYPFDMYLAHRDRHIRVIFQTDHGQLLVGSLPPVEEGLGWRSDPLGSLQGSLAADPITHALVGSVWPDGKVRGTVRERYFFRRAAGPGWALIGDAGHHKDFVVGDGITEALIQAKGLAAAVTAGSDAAVIRWWRSRDVEALPQYYWGRDEGALGTPTDLQSRVVRRVALDPGLRRRMTDLPEHKCSPYEALPLSVILGCVFSGLLRGNLGVVPEFLAQGRKAADYGRVLKERQRLLHVGAAGCERSQVRKE